MMIPEDLKQNLSKGELFAEYRLFLLRVAYSNVTLVFEGRKPTSERLIPSLDESELYQRLFVGKKGGYCYETSEFLYYHLESLGFAVKRCKAIVVNCPLSDIEKIDGLLISKPSTHNVLIVTLNGTNWLLDPGFVPFSPMFPIELSDEPGILEAEQNNLVFKIECLKPSKAECPLYRVSFRYAYENSYICLYQICEFGVTHEDSIDSNNALVLMDRHIAIRDDFLLVAKVAGDGQLSIKKTFIDSKVVFTEYTQKQQASYEVNEKEGLKIIEDVLGVKPCYELECLLFDG